MKTEIIKRGGASRRTTFMIPEDALFLESELLHECVVAALVGSLEVTQVRAAIGNHLEEAPARMKILRILL